MRILQLTAFCRPICPAFTPVVLFFSFSLLPFFTFGQDFDWAVRAWGTGRDAAAAVVCDADEIVYSTGYFSGDATFGNQFIQGKGLHEVYVAAHNPGGSLRWVRSLGGTGYDQGTGIALSADNLLWTCGYFEKTIFFGNDSVTAQGDNDGFVASWDRQGNLQNFYPISSTGSLRVNAISTDNNGNIVFCGAFTGTLSLGNATYTATGGIDLFVAKMYANGVIWQSAIADGNLEVNPRSLAIDASNNVHLTGTLNGNAVFGVHTISSFSVSPSIFVARFTSEGAWGWVKRAGFQYSDSGNGIANDPDGNSYVTGFFEGTASFDSFTAPWVDHNDAFLAKYDPTGQVQWLIPAGSTGNDLGTSVAFGNGKIYWTGIFQNSFGIGNQTLQGNHYDLFVAEVTQAGQINWVKQAGERQADISRAITVNPAGKIVLGGYYYFFCNFGSIALDKSEDADIFIASLDPLLQPLSAPEKNTASQCDRLSFTGRGIFASTEAAQSLEVTDMAGRKLLLSAKSRFSDRVYFELNHLPQGVYIARIPDRPGCFVRFVLVN